jgi:FemAB-related protein (PEP-CTERM system-associated)
VNTDRAVEATPAVDLFRAGDEAAWDGYVDSRGDSTLYHLRAWKDVVAEAFGLEVRFLMAREGEKGRVCGVLPLMRGVRPFSSYLATGPFGAYGPLLADSPEIARALVARAKRLVDEGQGKFLHIKILGAPPQGLDLHQEKIWVTLFCDLEENEAALFKRLGSQMRNEIRNGEKSKLVKAIGPGELEGFYDVLNENMTGKGTPMYGRRFFQSLLQHLGPERSGILTLRHEGQVVSGAFMAWHHGVMYVPFASSRPSVFKLRANYVMYWEILKQARALGCRSLDLGTSMNDSSGLVFKQKWATRTEEITSLLYAPGGKLPILKPKESRLLATGIKLWSNMPGFLTDALGPTVCKWTA